MPRLQVPSVVEEVLGPVLGVDTRERMEKVLSEFVENIGGVERAQQAIVAECNTVKALLLSRSAGLEPINVFSKEVREMVGEAGIPVDPVLECIGYLLLRRVAERWVPDAGTVA